MYQYRLTPPSSFADAFAVACMFVVCLYIPDPPLVLLRQVSREALDN